MSSLHKDILIGLMFIAAMWSFISGEFVVLTLLFPSAAIYSNRVSRVFLIVCRVFKQVPDISAGFIPPNVGHRGRYWN
jgi:hypothetical protein